MKRPVPVSTPYWISRLATEVTIAKSAAPELSVAETTPQPALLGAQGLHLLDKPANKQDEPGVLAGVLKYLKFSPDEIKRIEKFIDTIGKIASTVTWIIGAVSTVKDLLTLAGVLEEDDAAAKLQQQIAEQVQTIYSYLENTEKKNEYKLAVDWRSAVQRTKTDIHNLALSRTQSNLDSLATSIHHMMEEAIRPMLALRMGDIPFVRTTYGGRPSAVVYENELPNHWSDYAFPLWMQTTGGQPVSNGNFLDLGSTIWDAGYYLDVLIEAIGVLISGLAALEAGFRSTAYDRLYFRDIASGLTAFIDKWEKSLLITNVVGPLDPEPDISGGHRIHHPWAGWSAIERPGLPIGAIDPVSGIAAFDPLWNDGFNMHFVSESASGLAPALGYWTLENYDQVVTAAYAYRASLLRSVRDHCGINRLRELRDSVYALIGPPSPSEFVSVADTTFARADITGVATTLVWSDETDEEVDLGVIGQFAGQPGKKYPAKRWYQYITKSFRIPMARRMDYSKTQLGYRLTFTVGKSSAVAPGDSPINVSTVLAEYSAQTIPGEDQPIFPSESVPVDLQSDTAGVYDVLQTGPLSAHDEQLYENTGKVPGQRRLFLNVHDGPVAAKVNIDFELDIHNPDSPFIGFANVTVGTLDPVAHPGGFILDIEVYETVMLAPEDPPRDERREMPAAMVRLHFAPSFLVVGSDYFNDRDAGLEAMGKAMKSVSDQYARSKQMLGPRDPVENIKRTALEQAQMETMFAEVAHQSRQQAAQLVTRYAVPALRQG